MITALKYIAAAIGLASTTWLAMLLIGSRSLFVLYIALMYPWVAPVFAAVVVGLVALWKWHRAVVGRLQRGEGEPVTSRAR